MGKRKGNSSPNPSHYQLRKRPKKDTVVTYKKAETWNSGQVCQHLEENGLEDIKKVFHDAQIDGRVFLLLAEPLLKKLGVDPEDKRRQVLDLVDQIKKSDKLSESEQITVLSKVVNDPIHGHIELHPLVTKIIDTPQFQRLRYLKQLGGCYYVYPGASHNRFEHCIGVSHLAGELTEAIRGRQPDLGITDQDVFCVRIAGLCHDLGHGPFSHVFDDMFMSRVNPGKKWTHEDASVKMFDHLVESNDLMPEFERYGLDKRDLLFIKEQIAGPLKNSCGSEEQPYFGRDKDKSFLYEVVANKRNGIDVDKWDYFSRDCYHLGISSNFDHWRFMKFARVLKVEGQMQICSRDKEAGDLYDMFHTRYALHRRACKHKTKGIIEEMIAEALVKANDHIPIQGKDGKQVKLSDAVDDMVAYTKLTDHIFQQILYSESPELADSREILQRIQRRQLYKCVGQTKPKAQTVLPKSPKERKKLLQEIVIAVSEDELAGEDCEPPEAKDVVIQSPKERKKLLQEIVIAVSKDELAGEGCEPPEAKDVITQLQSPTEREKLLQEMVDAVSEKELAKKDCKPLKAKDVIIELVNMDYGMKKKNPIDHVHFYRKEQPTQAIKVEQDQLSHLLPKTFSEHYIRAFTKITDEKSVKAAALCFDAWCKKNDYIPIEKGLPKGDD